MGDFFQGKDERIVNGTRYTRYLDLNNLYGIMVPKDENAYNEMCDYKVWDDNRNRSIKKALLLPIMAV